MSKKYIVSENQFSMLMKRLTEVAAGYDDFFTMSRHGGISLGNLVALLTDLITSIKELHYTLNEEDVSYKEIEDVTMRVDSEIDEIKKLMLVVFKDFTEKNTINKGKILIKKLTKFQQMIKMFNHYGTEVFDEENELVNRMKKLIQQLGHSLHDYSEELRLSNENMNDILQRHKPKYNN